VNCQQKHMILSKHTLSRFQFLRRLKNCNPLGCQRLIASTDILLHLPLHLNCLNPYSHTLEAPTVPTTTNLQLQASPTSLKPCQVLIQIPTTLTHHLFPNKQMAHKIPSITRPSSIITLTLTQGQIPMLPSNNTLMQPYRTIEMDH
jgi:hypothetical protein